MRAALSNGRLLRTLLIRDPPDPTFLRVSNVQGTVRPFADPYRPVRRRRTIRRRAIETGEAVSEYCGRSRLPVAIERHELDVVAELVLRAMEHDKRAAAVLARKGVAGVEEEIDRRGTARVEG